MLYTHGHVVMHLTQNIKIYNVKWNWPIIRFPESRGRKLLEFISQEASENEVLDFTLSPYPNQVSVLCNEFRF